MQTQPDQETRSSACPLGQEINGSPQTQSRLNHPLTGARCGGVVVAEHLREGNGKLEPGDRDRPRATKAVHQSECRSSGQPGLMPSATDRCSQTAAMEPHASQALRNPSRRASLRAGGGITRGGPSESTAGAPKAMKTAGTGEKKRPGPPGSKARQTNQPRIQEQSTPMAARGYEAVIHQQGPRPTSICRCRQKR